MPARDPPANSLVSTTKRAASIGQLSQASSYEEVRLEDLDRSSDSEEDRVQKAEATASLPEPQKAETPSKSEVTARPSVPTAKPEDMHMIDDDNELVQPNDKKDVSLRELHDPIEGDSANISWRGNHDVKAQAGEAKTLSMLAVLAYESTHCQIADAAKEAKAHDIAGDNPKDFDPFKDAERAAHKAAALAAATVNNLNLKDMSTKVRTTLCPPLQLMLVLRSVQPTTSFLLFSTVAGG